MKSERGKFDFDHHFAFFTNFLKYITFCLVASMRGLFSNKNCPKRIFPSDFVKFCSEILYLFLAEKWSVCFVATLSDFGLFFLLIEELIELRKMKGKNYSMYGLGIAQPLRYSYSASVYKDAIVLTSRWKVHFRQTFFSK